MRRKYLRKRVLIPAACAAILLGGTIALWVKMRHVADLEQMIPGRAIFYVSGRNMAEGWSVLKNSRVCKEIESQELWRQPGVVEVIERLNVRRRDLEKALGLPVNEETILQFFGKHFGIAVLGVKPNGDPIVLLVSKVGVKPMAMELVLRMKGWGSADDGVQTMDHEGVTVSVADGGHVACAMVGAYIVVANDEKAVLDTIDVAAGRNKSSLALAPRFSRIAKRLPAGGEMVVFADLVGIERAFPGLWEKAGYGPAPFTAFLKRGFFTRRGMRDESYFETVREGPLAALVRVPPGPADAARFIPEGGLISAYVRAPISSAAQLFGPDSVGEIVLETLGNEAAFTMQDLRIERVLVNKDEVRPVPVPRCTVVVHLPDRLALGGALKRALNGNTEVRDRVTELVNSSAEQYGGARIVFWNMPLVQGLEAGHAHADKFLLVGTGLKEAVDRSAAGSQRRRMLPGFKRGVPARVNSWGAVEVGRLATRCADYLDALLASEVGAEYTERRWPEGLPDALRCLRAVRTVSWVVTFDGRGIRKSAVFVVKDLP